ncbi:hypothetical protein KAS08_03460 [Candidatus Pacearchaeota archaeon]|nr:hypothetical protein [Candidatus Pacearchaeota archaeon]
MWRVKKGSLETNEMIGLIIGVAVFIILIMVFKGAIFSSLGSGNVEESSDAYFKTFEKEVAKANEGNIGEFIMWQRMDDKGERDVFLIYFGDKYTFNIGDRRFVSMNNKNSICVCFWDGEEDACKKENCASFDRPVNYDGDYGQWAISTGDKIHIIREEEEYKISKVVKDE